GGRTVAAKVDAQTTVCEDAVGLNRVASGVVAEHDHTAAGVAADDILQDQVVCGVAEEDAVAAIVGDGVAVDDRAGETYEVDAIGGIAHCGRAVSAGADQVGGQHGIGSIWGHEHTTGPIAGDDVLVHLPAVPIEEYPIAAVGQPREAVGVETD